MSYCTVEQVGTVRWSQSSSANSTIEHVKATAELLDRALGYDALYSVATWTLSPIMLFIQADGKLELDLGYPVIDLTSVKYYTPIVTLGNTIEPQASLGASVNGLNSRWWNGIGDLLPSGILNYERAAQDLVRADGRLQVTASRGVAEVGSPAESPQTLKAGQSVIRGGKVVLIEADGIGHINDKLLTPPPLLRNIAVSIARRLVRMERDQTAGLNIDNLTQGYEMALRYYTSPDQYRRRA